MGRQADDTNPGLPKVVSTGTRGVGSARLVQIGGALREEVGRVLLLDRDRLVLGRGVDSALVLADQATSRNHARIERDGAGFTIVDLDSLNGVRVNEVLVKSAPLRDGDRVQLGQSTVLRFSTAAIEDWFPQRLEPDHAAGWTFYVDTQQLEWSANADRVLRRAGATLSGQRVELAAAVHPDDLSRAQADLTATAASGEPLDLEVRLAVGVRTWRWVSLRGQLLRSATGKPECISGVAVDVNDRKRRELELNRMGVMFESLTDGVFLTDELGRVVDLNTAAKKMFNAEKESALGVDVFEVIGAPSSAELQAVALKEIRDAGRWTRELHIPRTNRDLPFVVLGFPLRSDDDVLGAAFLFRDLTERQQLQTQLAFYDRLSSLGTLSAGIAHEINNPLSFVINNLEHVLRWVSELNHPDSAESLDALADALEGTRRIAGIVRDLKAFSRDDIATTPVPTNVLRALDVAMKMTSKLATTRARLVTDLPKELPFAHATESRLSQVFVNLLINAIQAIPDGAKDAQITVRARVADDHLTIEISDTGVGMSPEVLLRVFDPFFTTKPQGVGTGLGLSICHGLVTAFGGQLSATSELGKGSTFTVRLKRARQAQVSAAPPLATVAVKTARLLIIDDEPMLLRALERSLSEHEVVTCGSVDEALPELRTGRFDVVLCDLMMPGRTGIDLYRTLQQERPELLPTIVFVTGGAFTEDARAFLAGVPNRIVSKPIETAELSRVIVEQLRRVARSSVPTVELNSFSR